MVILEIVAPICSVDQVEALLSCYCATLGDEVLSCQGYEEVQECFFVIWVKDEQHLSGYLSMLSHARHERLISWFDAQSCSLLRLCSPTILEQMRTFPLTWGNSWIPSKKHTHEVYLYIDEAVLRPCQREWLRIHEDIVWTHL